MINELNLPTELRQRLFHLLDEIPHDEIKRLPEKIDLLVYEWGLMKTFGNKLILSEVFQVNRNTVIKRARELGLVKLRQHNIKPVKRVDFLGD